MRLKRMYLLLTGSPACPSSIATTAPRTKIDDQSIGYEDQKHAYVSFETNCSSSKFSATDQRPISSERDPVLTHLLESFPVK